MNKIKLPFFIVGSGRSGTTLLQSMIMTIQGIYIPPETKLLGLIENIETFHGSITNNKSFRLLIYEIINLCKRDEFPVNLVKLKKELTLINRTRRSVFDVLLYHIQKQSGCRRIGEKSPLHLEYSKDILKIFPDGKIIAIIRDGRDVASSQKEIFKLNVLHTALVWRRDQQLIDKYLKSVSRERFMAIRYEDLIANPKKELKNICLFLKEDFNESMLEFYKRKNIGFAKREKHKYDTQKPIFNTKQNRYKNDLSDREIALFELIAKKQLIDNNYKLEKKYVIGGIFQIIICMPSLIYVKLKWIINNLIR
ncbi:MAG: hypothetical protein UR69_C0001G0131 [Candidatus Moranbacteria bacterium GW2011_GWE2_35_2-]|nr:MAG: hypothetical protein UR69_C0001G0131 [Candidatus Moranbacteria bacterium GW2011_GWE2_35_2-]KKQ06815.1 MAG: hypothetical protein US15_C0003G0013 [Candidatus Moranbacteria bacterium GW2011_GWF1_36_4]KKQ22871.1 MAG: hypothetical protein US37_C0001G0143 [Candidatus Moranbacteria bacterium GW2011_GWF2_37_11]KKQ29229.1 MAG: hypothetical protein US44_C0002G0011 [Candidatus Moranbacteria bacterium GW2011_GWD1_37_17]KKQ30898.1 MAG: hypothetical protein US47_C0001G0131 [Candidatus Moranbacteria b